MPTYRYRWSWNIGAVLVVLLLAGCASAPSNNPPQTPAQAAYADYGVKLEEAVAVYKAAMTAVGEADGRGLLTAAQVAKALEVGEQAESALNAAKDALLLYLQVLDVTTGGNLASEALESKEALRSLGDLLRSFGVALPAGTEEAIANLAKIARELGGGR